jgi:hypothetical protein
MFVVEIARELSVLVALAVAAAAPGDAAAEAARSTEAQVCVVSGVGADSPVGGDSCRSVLAAADRDDGAENPGDDDAEPGGASAPDCGSGERSAPADDEGGDAKTGDDDGDPGDVAEQDDTDDSAKARDEERDDSHDNDDSPDNKDNDEDKESKERGGAEASRDTADGRDDDNTGEKVRAVHGGTNDDAAAAAPEDVAGSAVSRPAGSAGCARGEDATDTSGASDHRAGKGAACVDSSTRGSSSGQDNARDDRAGDEDSRNDDADRPAREGRSDGDAPEPSYPTQYDRPAGADANEASLTGQPIRQVARQRGSARHPADLLTPGQWYLTLPTGEPGRPDTVDGEKLATFSNEFFQLNDSRDGIVFAANAGGVTTKNSTYARSELREMDGTEKAAWSNISGRHTLQLCEAITKVPDGGKPEVVAAQIHDGNDDVLQIRLEGKTLLAQYADGEQTVVLDAAYQLGTPYSLTIDASDSKVVVFYNDQQKADLPLAGDGWYWKVGAYVQSNVERGADPGAIGEVVLHSVRVTHS